MAIIWSISENSRNFAKFEKIPPPKRQLCISDYIPCDCAQPARPGPAGPAHSRPNSGPTLAQLRPNSGPTPAISRFCCTAHAQTAPQRSKRRPRPRFPEPVPKRSIANPKRCLFRHVSKWPNVPGTRVPGTFGPPGGPDVTPDLSEHEILTNFAKLLEFSEAGPFLEGIYSGCRKSKEFQ